MTTASWHDRIRTAADLVTTQDQIVNGFVVQAAIKAERATVFIELAETFRRDLDRVYGVESALGNVSIAQLAAATHISQKAARQIQPEGLVAILRSVLEQVYTECVATGIGHPFGCS